MASKYKIRARILPYQGVSTTQAARDVRLAEQTILVPMDGSQTVADLYFEIQRFYSEIFTQAGELRIRCLETGDGDLLHTSLRISDCFEQRTSTSDSAQWTVVVKRQAPTSEEIEEYKRNVRQFSFDDLSFARPQIPYSRGQSNNAQELSSTPLQKQLQVHAPIQSDTANDVLQSMERDDDESQALQAWRSRHSPSLVPNSQLPTVAVRSSLNAVPETTVQEELEVVAAPEIPAARKSTLHKVSNVRESQKPAHSFELDEKYSQAHISQNGIDKTPQTSKKTDNKPAPRNNIFDIRGLRKTTPSPPPPIPNNPPELSSETQLSQSHRSVSSTQSLVSVQPAKAHEKVPRSRTTSVFEDAADVDGASVKKGRQVENNGADRSNAKLAASLARERKKTQELVSTLPITPSHRRSHKLTPFFPTSGSKLTSGSTETRIVRNAADAGIDLLRSDKSLPQNNNPPSPTSPQLLNKFSPNHFREADRRALAPIQNQEPRKSNGVKNSKQLPKVQPAEIPENESGTDHESERDEESEAARSSPIVHSGKDTTLEAPTRKKVVIAAAPFKTSPKKVVAKEAPSQTSTKEVTGTVAPSKTPIRKTTADEDSPAKNLTVDNIKVTANRESPDVRSSFSNGSEHQIEATQQPVKRGRGRPPGSKAQPKPKPKPKEENPAVAPRKRGRPLGSKGKNKSATKANSSVILPKTYATKTIPPESAIESDLEEPEQTTTANQGKTKASTTTKRKRKEKDSAIPIKRARKTSDSSDVANAGAMAESTDRKAVVSAADVMQIDRSPVSSKETPSPQSKAKPPAQQERSAVSDDQSDTGSDRETSEEDSDTEPEKVKPKKSKLQPPKALQGSSYDSRVDSEGENEAELPPLYSEITAISSADPAAAQLQFEDTASLKDSTPTLPKANSGAPKRPVSDFPTARVKYTSFSDMRKQQVNQKSQQQAHSTQTKSQLNQKTRNQPPPKANTPSDDSESSSESDSDQDIDDQSSNPNITAEQRKIRRAFSSLLNREKT